MTEDFINVLHAIGTPVVIIAAAAVAILMRSISNKLSIAGGIITLISVVVYIPIDLAPKARDAWGETNIQIRPNNFHSFSNDFSPTKVSVVMKRGDKEIKNLEIPPPNANIFENKKIFLERKSEDKLFIAKVGEMAVGSLTDEELESKGFVRKTNTASQPQKIATSKRVYIGRSWSVGNTPLGKLELTFSGIKQGKAVLKLSSSTYGAPQPESVELSNKEFKVQSFEGNYEVTVQVGQADFQTQGQEWAVFTIIIA